MQGEAKYTPRQWRAANGAFNEMVTWSTERDGHSQARSHWLSGKQRVLAASI